MTELESNLIGFPQRVWAYIKHNAARNNHKDVLNIIDEYCWNNERDAMNVGDVKGKILDQLVAEKQPQNVLELGTYCGYSAIRIAALLDSTSKVYTIENDEVTARIAKKIIDYSGLGHKIEILIGNSAAVLHNIKSITGVPQFDFVFFDHWKQHYKPDLITLENLQLIGKGAWVVADNVIYPGCPDYIEYVRNSPKYESTNYPSLLEYSNTVKDSIEKSVYLCDSN